MGTSEDLTKKISYILARNIFPFINGAYLNFFVRETSVC